MTGSSWIPELPIPSAAMTADEFRERLEELGLSQSAFARKAGIHVRSAQKYARGERPIPAVVVALLDAWAALARIRQELDG